MSEEGALARIDRTLERMDARWVEEQRRWEERERRWEELQRENRRFHDALLERIVRITEEQIAAMQSGFTSLQAEIADQRAQLQAQTEAIWAMIDRLPPPHPRG